MGICWPAGEVTCTQQPCGGYVAESPSASQDQPSQSSEEQERLPLPQPSPSPWLWRSAESHKQIHSKRYFDY